MSLLVVRRLMTISRIETNEYQCVLCKYRWINRIDGRDGHTPSRCAKCKARNWNEGTMRPKENGLRRRLRGMKKLYEHVAFDFLLTEPSISKWWDNELTEMFLSLTPRPTINELNRVVNLPGLPIGLTSESRWTWKGYVPTAEGRWKFDLNEYLRIIHSEAQQRQDVMRQIIEERSG